MVLGLRRGRLSRPSYSSALTLRRGRLSRRRMRLLGFWTSVTARFAPRLRRFAVNKGGNPLETGVQYHCELHG